MSTEKLFKEFVDKVEKDGLFVEGIAIADKDKVLFEHRFKPDLPRNIYSHTKSYTSTAAGIAIDEGKLSLSDKICDYFPEFLPEDPDPRLLKIKLCHLMTMSSGFGAQYLMSGDRRAGVGAPDYLTYMLSRPMQKEPGEEFLYSSADTVLVVRMIEKAVGMRLGEYMFTKVFSKLAQGWPIWEHDPQGHPNGGGGLCMRLTEMMKLGQLYLNDGVWQGERVVSSDWVKTATTKKIETPSDDIWSVGYGYQFWMAPYPNSCRCSGSFGQTTVILPESGLVVSVQCPEYGDFSKVKPALHEMLAQL